MATQITSEVVSDDTNVMSIQKILAISIPMYGMRLSNAATNARNIAYLMPSMRKPIELSAKTIDISISSLENIVPANRARFVENFRYTLLASVPERGDNEFADESFVVQDQERVYRQKHHVREHLGYRHNRLANEVWPGAADVGYRVFKVFVLRFGAYIEFLVYPGL